MSGNAFNGSFLKKVGLNGMALLLLGAGLGSAFTNPPGPVKNVRTLPVFRHSVEVMWDAPADPSEVKAYFLNWQATDGTGLGSKMVPPEVPNMAQIQLLDPAKVYTINIYPVDAGGHKGAPVTLTNIRSQGTYEAELENSTQNGQSGFLFLPERDLPMMRTDITKLNNDVEGGILFSGNTNGPTFQFASVANNKQDHWHQTGRQTNEGTMTTRVKGKVYLGDGGTRSVLFDNDMGPVGARAWYVILSPVKMDRFHLIPRGGEDGDDAITAWPQEQIRVKIVQENARVSRYAGGTKVSQVPFNWRKKAYFNSRQRLRLDINQKGVTFLADTEYTGAPQILGTFGTDLTGWTHCYVYFAMGMYTPRENSRGGYNSAGTPVAQDALALFHWGNVAFTAPAGQAPATELSYFKDPDMAVRMHARVNPANAFTIRVDTMTPDVAGRELIFTDATYWPQCNKPGDTVLQVLSNPGTQVLVNGTPLASKTQPALRAQAPAYSYDIPPGVLRAGDNTVQIVQSQNPKAISIFNPHIDVMVPAGSSMITAYTPPPVSEVLDMMPDDALLRGWALPSVDFYPPRMASGTVTMPYSANSAHTLVTSGVQVGMTTFTATVDGTPFFAQYINPEGIGTPYTEGILTLTTTDYADGYHKVVFRAHTLTNAVGEANGSDPNSSGTEMDYDFNRTMLFYNGPAVATPPAIDNVILHELNRGTTIASTGLMPGATGIVRSDHHFRLNFDVTTEGFIEDMALYYQDEMGVWRIAGKHKNGSLEDSGGHFNSGLAALTPLGNNRARLTYTWDYEVDAAHEMPFVYNDPDGPGIHYKLVAQNVGQFRAEFPFTFKLHDPDMAIFEQVNLPPQITINQPLNATIVVKNIGTTTWTPDGNYVLGQFDEETPQLFGEHGLPVTTSVAPGQSVTLHTNYTPVAPAAMDTFHPEMRTLDPDFEMFTSTQVTTAIVTGNDAAFVNQSVVTTMDPNLPYSVTVIMQNTGVTTWTAAAGYYLVGVNPAYNVLWSVPQVPLGPTDSIAPGQAKTFTFNVYSPGFPNIYDFQWQMDQMTSHFGELFGQKSANVKITVGDISPVLPSFVTQPTDQGVQPGQTATFWATVVGKPNPGYQWRVRAATSTLDPNPPFVDLPGETGTSFTTPVTTLAHDGMQYVLIASNTAGAVESFHATLRVSTAALSVVGQLATYSVNITNGVSANGLNFLPKMLNLGITKSEGVAANDLRLLIGKGSNYLPLTQSALLDPNQSSTPSIDMTTVTNINHQDLLNFAVYVEEDDGTTFRTLINPLYTVLLLPPAAPNLSFLPAQAGSTQKIQAGPLFADKTIGSTAFTFTRNGLAGPGSGLPSAPAPAASASLSLARSAPVLDLGQMPLSLGSYNVQATATDWVGNVSAPAQAVIFIITDDLADTRVYPSPWDVRKTPGQPLRFANLTPVATIKIFTVSGHWVKTLQAENGVATWDLKNDAGQNVASGLYLYLITNDRGQKARGQFGVIR